MFDREQHTLNLPAVNSITYVLRFLEKLCHNLRSDNLFGNQPFTQTHLSLNTTEYSHSHERYLPGRSWDGAWAKEGGRTSSSTSECQPSHLLAWHLPSGGLVFCSYFCHVWDSLVSSHLYSLFRILSPLSRINLLSSGFLSLEKDGSEFF